MGQHILSHGASMCSKSCTTNMGVSCVMNAAATWRVVARMYFGWKSWQEVRGEGGEPEFIN
jgi:hypothetical protein